jgi:hypothetical protein
MKVYSTVLIIIILLGANLAQAERLAVSASVANVRSGPGTEYDILFLSLKKPIHGTTFGISRATKAGCMIRW